MATAPGPSPMQSPRVRRHTMVSNPPPHMTSGSSPPRRGQATTYPASEKTGVAGGVEIKKKPRAMSEMTSDVAGSMTCEICGKGYKHASCLSKHRWEHSPHWSQTSKLLISKHQQVQLLEAAQILSAGDRFKVEGYNYPVVFEDEDDMMDVQSNEGQKRQEEDEEMFGMDE